VETNEDDCFLLYNSVPNMYSLVENKMREH
jgi:hypothetical protein